MHIFLSYPHKDRAKTLRLRDALRGGGHTVWMDDQLVTGQPWQDQLEAQIKRAGAVALALTPHWVRSPNCQWEFITAVENGVQVVPVLLEKVSRLPQRLGRLQYADLSGGFRADAVQKLLDDLHTLATTVDPAVIADMDKQTYATQIDYGHHNVIGDGNVVTQTGDITIGGSVSGGNVNIGGSQVFHGNVTINANAIPASDDHRQALASLIEQLNAALRTIPPDDAEVIEALAQDAVNEASKEMPNKRLLKAKGESLTKEAQNLAAVAPIASQIAKTLLLIGD